MQVSKHCRVCTGYCTVEENTVLFYCEKCLAKIKKINVEWVKQRLTIEEVEALLFKTFGNRAYFV